MYIFDLKDLDSDAEKFGMKALSLNKLIKDGFRVPLGFVISSDAFLAFLKENGILSKVSELLDNLNVNDINDLQAKSNELKDLIMRAQLPLALKSEIKEAYGKIGLDGGMRHLTGEQLDIINANRADTEIAVRSSFLFDNPKISFSGFHPSYLYVSGLLGVFEMIKNCWASLFSPEALFARAKYTSGIKNFRMAVVIQKMIRAEESGLIATINPMTKSNNVLIESTFGPGLIETGTMVPDIYILDKETHEIIAKKVSLKEWRISKHAASGNVVRERLPADVASAETLSGNDLSALLELTKRIEAINPKPQIIEWAFMRDGLYVLGTQQLNLSIDNNAAPASQSPYEKPMLAGLGVSNGIVEGTAKIIHYENDLYNVSQGSVIIAQTLPPKLIFAFDKTAGIISCEGSPLSNTAITARELNIPLIVGVKNATNEIKDNSVLEVDGTTGKIFLIAHQAPESVALPAEEISLEKKDMITATKVKYLLDSMTIDDMGDKADGVGLCPSELILLNMGKHPSSFVADQNHDLPGLIEQKIAAIAEQFYPKEVWFQSLSTSTSHLKNLDGGESEPAETNPMMGWRGVRRSLDSPSLFNVELAAIKNLINKGYENIGLILPFVRDSKEVEKAKQLMQQADVDVNALKLGVAIEIPASVFMAGEFAEAGVKFAVINADRLAEYILALDKSNPRVSSLYQPANHAVLKLIGFAIKEFKKNGIETSIFGSVVSNHSVVEKLVEFGIDSIITGKADMEIAKAIVARTEKKMLLDILRAREKRYENLNF